MGNIATKSTPPRSCGDIIPSLRRRHRERRVVVTGIGIVTPLGTDLDVFWNALLAGRSCISNISRLDTSDLPVHIGGQVAAVEPTPFRACRPFDSARDGLVISEAAAMLVLEDLEHARARGARCYGEIAGYGATSDASHLTAPDPSGQSEAIERALRSAGLVPEDVDHVNAHGTSTKLNDEAESRALRLALGAHADHVAVTANKSMLGHTMGASGALELVGTLFTLRDGIIPPTINYETPDPLCDLDYVHTTIKPSTQFPKLASRLKLGKLADPDGHVLLDGGEPLVEAQLPQVLVQLEIRRIEIRNRPARGFGYVGGQAALLVFDRCHVDLLGSIHGSGSPSRLA